MQCRTWAELLSEKYDNNTFELAILCKRVGERKNARERDLNTRLGSVAVAIIFMYLNSSIVAQPWPHFCRRNSSKGRRNHNMSLVLVHWSLCLSIPPCWSISRCFLFLLHFTIWYLLFYFKVICLFCVTKIRRAIKSNRFCVEQICYRGHMRLLLWSLYPKPGAYKTPYLRCLSSVLWASSKEISHSKNKILVLPALVRGNTGIAEKFRCQRNRYKRGGGYFTKLSWLILDMSTSIKCYFGSRTRSHL